MSVKPPLIQFDTIRKVYGAGPTEYEALKGISFTIAKGEFVAIMGPSGSGKSTIMNIMGALDIASSGEYLLNGKRIEAYEEDELAEIRNREIGFVFQSFNLLPRMTVLKNVERPLMYANVPATERTRRAMECLKLVGLEKKAQNLSNHISGGQIQRVAIARALATNPAIILADEPTGNLDSKTARVVMEFFQELNRNGHSIILITHEKNIARFAQRIITVADGSIAKDEKQS